MDAIKIKRTYIHYAVKRKRLIGVLMFINRKYICYNKKPAHHIQILRLDCNLAISIAQWQRQMETMFIFSYVFVYFSNRQKGVVELSMQMKKEEKLNGFRFCRYDILHSHCKWHRLVCEPSISFKFIPVLIFFILTKENFLRGALSPDFFVSFAVVCCVRTIATWNGCHKEPASNSLIWIKFISYNSI